MILMANVSKIVRAQVAPAFRDFIREIAAQGNATGALAETVGVKGDARRAFGKSSEARHFHMLLEGDFGQPSVSKVWHAGEAARRMGVTWSSGLLFLFAAGHFSSFASVIIGATSSILPDTRKASLVAASVTACAPTVPITESNFLETLRRDNVSETSARAALQEFRLHGNTDARTDRNTLTLSLKEQAAFKDAFASTALPESPYDVALATCKLAEQAQGGILMQRRIAATALWHSLASRGLERSIRCDQEFESTLSPFSMHRDSQTVVRERGGSGVAVDHSRALMTGQTPHTHLLTLLTQGDDTDMQTSNSEFTAVRDAMAAQQISADVEPGKLVTFLLPT